ncbi:MAG: 16S rRNA (guanine(527)-N(7))-methyltransferase RsmG [Acidimicrobiales bacterium]
MTDGGESSDPGATAPAPSAALIEVLEVARSRGFLGPGPVRAHVAHALGYMGAVDRVGSHEGGNFRPGARIMDLGSGGGVPGLVLAGAWARAEVVLLDASKRRTDFLSWAVERLGLSSRVRVLACRAEEAGRDESERGCYDVVVARSFARPSVTAECGAPFLKVGGMLVVSEPPSDQRGDASTRDGKAGRGAPADGPPATRLPAEGPATVPSSTRWPETELGQLGLAVVGRTDHTFHFQVLRQASACPARFPRRSGIPAKRPLF